MQQVFEVKGNRRCCGGKGGGKKGLQSEKLIEAKVGDKPRK